MGWAQIMNFNPNFAAGETSHVLSQAKLRWGVRSVDELRWGVISWKPRKTWVSSFTIQSFWAGWRFWNMNFIFHFIKKGCHPSHSRTRNFQDGAPPSSGGCLGMSACRENHEEESRAVWSSKYHSLKVCLKLEEL